MVVLNWPVTESNLAWFILEEQFMDFIPSITRPFGSKREEKFHSVDVWFWGRERLFLWVITGTWFLATGLDSGGTQKSFAGNTLTLEKAPWYPGMHRL
jgi:hypothetical protein